MFPLQDALDTAADQNEDFQAFLDASDEPLTPRKLAFSHTIGETRAPTGHSVTKTHEWKLTLQRGGEAWTLTVTRETQRVGPPNDTLEAAREIPTIAVPDELKDTEGTRFGEAVKTIEDLVETRVDQATFVTSADPERSAPHRSIVLSWGETDGSVGILPTARIWADGGRLLSLLDEPNVIEKLVFSNPTATTASCSTGS